VAETIERASSLRRDGELGGIETIAKYVTADLGYVVQIERAKAKIGAREEITPYAVRATNIFRREDGAWKMVHRHADPLTTVQTPESVLQK
jgi:ketosteroid isomerase-like protein